VQLKDQTAKLAELEANYKVLLPKKKKINKKGYQSDTPSHFIEDSVECCADPKIQVNK